LLFLWPVGSQLVAANFMMSAKRQKSGVVVTWNPWNPGQLREISSRISEESIDMASFSFSLPERWIT
jgi:hypothetical protein